MAIGSSSAAPICEKRFIVFDNDGNTGDCLAVFPNAHEGSSSLSLSLSEGGLAVSEWGYLPLSSQHGRHLGTIVESRALSLGTQRHITARLGE